MEIESDRCKKYFLPNGKKVDILTDVFEEVCNWIQDSDSKPESGGFILGYKHSDTGNITLEEVTHPYKDDTRTRFFFKLFDLTHKKALQDASSRMSYYMGVWHTHPEDHPSPSMTDWNDWKTSLVSEKSGGEFLFFMIVGRKSIKLWAGLPESKEIVELIECEQKEGVYIL